VAAAAHTPARGAGTLSPAATTEGGGGASGGRDAAVEAEGNGMETGEGGREEVGVVRLRSRTRMGWMEVSRRFGAAYPVLSCFHELKKYLKIFIKN
jgi:hypothetical protein